MLSALRQAFLQKYVTAYEYFVWVGAFFFLVIGYLLRNVLSLIGYFIRRRGMPKITSSHPKTSKNAICDIENTNNEGFGIGSYSFKHSTIAYSFEFFGYSTLMLLSFLISKNPFLLGGTIGLAFGGMLNILALTKKK
jgi:uncharacterized protein YneF (UPF0154 family)